MQQIEIADLPKMGFIQITDIGEENIYFTDSDGNEFFVKLA